MKMRRLTAPLALLLAAIAIPGLGSTRNDDIVTAPHAMVVTAQHLATDVGVKILRAGGNAVDAAVAVGYALAVVHPCCGNIGGGGFMLIHTPKGKDIFLDFREKAPLGATADMFLGADGHPVPGLGTRGYKAVGVPGTVLGLETARMRYGTMSRKALMQPAIELAHKGYVLTPGDARILHFRTDTFRRQPNVAAIFLKKDGQPYAAGDRLRQPELAHTLELISSKGPDAFYKGPIARELVAASKANGGLFTMKDFADYTVGEETPVRCAYRGYDVVSSPPPSSGGTTMCEIFNVLSAFPMGKLGFHSAAGVHYMVEAMRHAYADRNTFLGDPAFVDNPLKRLLSPAQAAFIRRQIKPDRATPSSEVKGQLAPAEGNDTTHYSIVDAHGEAVAVTYTINYYFGNGAIAGDTGFFLNNEMGDFTSEPGVRNSFGLVQGKANAIAPGKRPLSSISPTFVTHNGHIFMVTGSPGGPRIITATLEGIMNVLDYHMDLAHAVNAPRIHHQWLPDVVELEPGALNDKVRMRLEEMGYHFADRDDWGATEAILVRPDGTLEGVNDARRPAGKAEGY